MSKQRVEEILQRPSAGSRITELGAFFLLAALAAHSFGGKDSPPVPTPSKPCVMTLTTTTCPK